MGKVANIYNINFMTAHMKTKDNRVKKETIGKKNASFSNAKENSKPPLNESLFWFR